jgi:hypothetical protein
MADKPVYTKQDFLKGIDELCKKMGYKLSIYPTFFQQDNGSFSIRINVDVEAEKK